MGFLLAFAITLLVASLVSDWAERTILSTAVLFLGAGFLLGSGFLPVATIPLGTLQWISEVALFSVLFTDGMRTGGVSALRQNWRLPGRALLIGLPLTIGGIAVIAHLLNRTTWMVAILIGAALSPTDPVFVSAIFRIEQIPEMIKRTLNIESGMNDGLALPAVLIPLQSIARHGSHYRLIAGDLFLGIAIGIVVPWIAIKVESLPVFKAVGVFKPLFTFSIGLLVYAVCSATDGNLFLAAFCAGITTASMGEAPVQAFREFGELIAELLKLGALLVLGIVLAPRIAEPLSWREIVFILVAAFVIRPAIMPLAFLGSGVSLKERLVIGWFGPKGFASVVYGLLVFGAALRREAHLIGLATICSIVVFSSTDLLAAKWFSKHQQLQAAQAERQNAA